MKVVLTVYLNDMNNHLKTSLKKNQTSKRFLHQTVFSFGSSKACAPSPAASATSLAEASVVPSAKSKSGGCEAFLRRKRNVFVKKASLHVYLTIIVYHSINNGTLKDYYSIMVLLLVYLF